MLWSSLIFNLVYNGYNNITLGDGGSPLLFNSFEDMLKEMFSDKMNAYVEMFPKNLN
jgi:hypothetical protein